MGADLKLVIVQSLQSRDEQFPYSRTTAIAHRMAQPVPAIEVTDHTDAFDVGRPDSKQTAIDAVDLL